MGNDKLLLSKLSFAWLSCKQETVAVIKLSNFLFQVALLGVLEPKCVVYQSPREPLLLLFELFSRPQGWMFQEKKGYFQRLQLKCNHEWSFVEMWLFGHSAETSLDYQKSACYGMRC